MLNGDDDDHVRHVGSVTLAERLKPLYRQLGISDRLDPRVYPGVGHVFTEDMQLASINWMRTFLEK